MCRSPAACSKDQSCGVMETDCMVAMPLATSRHSGERGIRDPDLLTDAPGKCIHNKASRGRRAESDHQIFCSPSQLQCAVHGTMAHLTRFFVITSYIALLSHPASAWTLVWRNASGDATVEHSQRSQSCQKINHAQGMQFDWDPEGDTYCLSLYRDADCKDRAGFSCPPWKKNASQHISSFDVKADDDFGPSSTTTASATSTSTSTSATTTLPSQTASRQTSGPSPSITPSSGSGNLSGGAIAGIVIGVVAGVSIIAAVFWLLGRRSRKPSENTVAPPDAPAEKPPELPLDKSAMAAAEKPPEFPIDSPPESPVVLPIRRPPGSRIVELPGDDHAVELSDTQRAVELEGSKAAQQHDGYGGDVSGR